MDIIKKKPSAATETTSVIFIQTIYPNETPSAWLEKAFARRTELREAGDAIATDLKRWLPSSWPLTKSSVKEMTETAVRAIEQGIDMMQEIDAEHRNNYKRPSP